MLTYDSSGKYVLRLVQDNGDGDSNNNDAIWPSLLAASLGHIDMQPGLDLSMVDDIPTIKKPTQTIRLVSFLKVSRGRLDTLRCFFS